MTGFKLFRDDGSGAGGPITTAVTAYDGQASLFVVSGLTAGAIYRFQYYAVNAFGDSPGSAILSAAASSLPAAPGAPVVDWAASGNTKLALSWAATSTGTLPAAPILGFLLEMDAGNATYTQVYDGSFRPGIRATVVSGLTFGHKYTFRVIALNYNGPSPTSATSTYEVCTAPSQFAAPEVVSQTSTAILLRWEPPKERGGCRITGYAVFRDGGSSAGTAINVEADPSIRNQPGLASISVTNFPAGTVGQAFRFQVQVFTTQRDALSEVAQALLAGVPA